MMHLLMLLGEPLREAIHLLQVLRHYMTHRKHVGPSASGSISLLEPIALTTSRMRAFLCLGASATAPKMLVRDGRIAHATARLFLVDLLIDIGQAPRHPAYLLAEHTANVLLVKVAGHLDLSVGRIVLALVLAIGHDSHDLALMRLLLSWWGPVKGLDGHRVLVQVLWMLVYAKVVDLLLLYIFLVCCLLSSSIGDNVLLLLID